MGIIEFLIAMGLGFLIGVLVTKFIYELRYDFKNMYYEDEEERKLYEEFIETMNGLEQKLKSRGITNVKVKTMGQFMEEQTKLHDLKFIKFCEEEFQTNLKWFKGYTSWSEKDYYKVMSDNLEELWKMYQESK